MFLGLLAFILSTSLDSKRDKEIGLQLWSLKDDVKSQGIEKVLEEVAKMGYSNLELAGYRKGLVYGMEPMDFKKLTDKYDLGITSSHVARKMSDNPEADMAFWKKAIQDHADMGVKYLIMPIMPLKNSYPYKEEQPVTMEDINKSCDYFNEIGKMAKAKGVIFGFHNHGHEHRIEVEGKPIFDWLLEKMDPENTVIEMDVYWVKDGGYNPVDYLKSHAGRFPILHIKDKRAVGESGETDFGPIFKAAYKQGMVGYYVEVEEYKGTPMEDVQFSFDYLNKAKYVK